MQASWDFSCRMVMSREVDRRQNWLKTCLCWALDQDTLFINIIFSTNKTLILFLLTILCCAVPSCSVVSDSLWPHGCNLPGSPVHGDSQGKNTGVGSLKIQGIFLTQKLNRGLLHCRVILYQVSYQGSPSTNKITPYSANSFRTRVGKTLAHRPNLFYRLFMWITFYWKLRELRPNSLSYMLSMAAFVLQRQSWVSVTKTGWPAEPKIFAIWPLLRFADPWLRIWTLMPFSTHLYARRVHRFYWILHITEIVPYALFWGLTFFFSWLYVLGIIPWQNIILLIYILWLHSNL